MTQFEVNGVRYIGVEVPPEVEHYIISDGFIKAWPVNQPAGIFYELLPAGNYEIVGLVSSLKDNNYENVSKLYPYTTYTHRARLCIELIRDFNLTDNTLILKTKENE